MTCHTVEDVRETAASLKREGKTTAELDKFLHDNCGDAVILAYKSGGELREEWKRGNSVKYDLPYSYSSMLPHYSPHYTSSKFQVAVIVTVLIISVLAFLLILRKRNSKSKRSRSKSKSRFR